MANVSSMSYEEKLERHGYDPNNIISKILRDDAKYSRDNSKQVTTKRSLPIPRKRRNGLR